MASNMSPSDPRVSQFLRFVGADSEECRLLLATASSFEKLAEKRSDLKKATLCGINRLRQRSLYKCVLWYEEFQRVHQREPMLQSDLTEDAIADFEANDDRIAVPEEAGLDHVLTCLNIYDRDLKRRLVASGIFTPGDVFRHREALEDGNFNAENLPSRVQKLLSQVADWSDEFSQVNDRPTNIVQDLTEKVFEDFLERNHPRDILCVDDLCAVVKAGIHCTAAPGFYRGLTEKQRPIVQQQIIDKIMEEVKSYHMPPNLHKMAPQFLDKQLVHCIKNLINLEGVDTFKTPVVVGGETQSGKSPVKAVWIAVCRALKVPAVVVTTNRSQAKELRSKLQDFTPESARGLVAEVRAMYDERRKGPIAEMMHLLENGAAFVIADTKSQMAKVNYAFDTLWKNKKVCFIADEGIVKLT